jgi:hypothetical protein
VDVTAWSKGLSVEMGGHGVVSHVGSGLVRLVADRVGLTSALSVALTRPGFWPVHDRGRVLTDLAVRVWWPRQILSPPDRIPRQQHCGTPTTASDLECSASGTGPAQRERPVAWKVP